MIYEWIDGFIITVKHDDEVIISANNEGLLSLANIFKALAAEPDCLAHVHLDQYNSLEDGSIELIIEKV